MKQYNHAFVVFKRPLLCCLATSSDGTFSRKSKIPLMKHSNMSVKKILCLKYLKQCLYKALSGNVQFWNINKVYFILFYDTTFVIDNIITCNKPKNKLLNKNNITTPTGKKLGTYCKPLGKY